MASSLSISDSALLLDNFIFSKSATINVTGSSSDDSPYFPVSNQLDPLRSSATRFDDTSTAKSVSFDFGEEVSPTVVAVVDSNMDRDDSFYVRCANSADMTTTDRCTWDFEYGGGADYAIGPVAAPHNVRIFYLPAPDTGTFDGQRYWQVQLDKTTSGGDTTDVGQIYIGTYEEQRISRLRDTIVDPSVISTSTGGAPHVDRLGWSWRSNVSIGGLTRKTASSLLESLSSNGTRQCIIDMHPNSGDDDVIAHGRRYGLVQDVRSAGTSFTVHAVNFRFQESGDGFIFSS